MIDLPILSLLPNHHKRVVRGHPWVYSNEVTPDPALQALAAGSLVSVVAEGKPLGTAMYNPKTLIAARFFSRDPGQAIDETFFIQRLTQALALRDRLFARRIIAWSMPRLTACLPPSSTAIMMWWWCKPTPPGVIACCPR